MSQPDGGTTNGNDLKRQLESTEFSPDEIRHRLPTGDLSDEATRAMVCAVRNPDGRVAELAATAGVDEMEVLDGFITTIESRRPLLADLGDVHQTLLDVLLERDTPPSDVSAAARDNLASAVSRRSRSATSPEYIAGLLQQADADQLYLTRRLSQLFAEGPPRRGAIAEFIENHGVRVTLKAMGEPVPKENMDRLADPDAEPANATAEMEIEFIKPNATKDDVEPGVAYHATVGTVRGYGIFVNLTDKNGREGPGGLVHYSNMPNLIQPREFNDDEQVTVRLVERTAKNELSFELAGIVESMRFQRQEFAPLNDEFNDEYTQDDEEADEVAEPVAADATPDREYASTAERDSGQAAASQSGGGSGRSYDDSSAWADRSKVAAKNHGIWKEGELYCRYCDSGPLSYPFGMPSHLRWCEEYNDETGTEEEETEDMDTTTTTTTDTADELPGEISIDDLRKARGPVELSGGQWMCPHVDEDGRPCGKTFPRSHQVTGHMSAHTFRGERVGHRGRTTADTRPAPSDTDDGGPGGKQNVLSEADRSLGSARPETGEHEMLTILGDHAPTADEGIEVSEVMNRVVSVQPQSVSPILATLYRKKLVDRDMDGKRGGNPLFRYYISDVGRLELDDMGPFRPEPKPPADSEPESDTDAPTPTDATGDATDLALDAQALGAGYVDAGLPAGQAAAVLRSVARRLDPEGDG